MAVEEELWGLATCAVSCSSSQARRARRALEGRVLDSTAESLIIDIEMAFAEDSQKCQCGSQPFNSYLGPCYLEHVTAGDAALRRNLLSADLDKEDDSSAWQGHYHLFQTPSTQIGDLFWRF